MFKSRALPPSYGRPMNTTPTMNDSDLPVFPAVAPAVFADAEATIDLFRPVLGDLASVVEVADDQLDGSTPCDGFDVAALRHHVLGWLQFFAAALNDPAGETDRLDPDTWSLGAEDRPSDIVTRAAADIETAIGAGVAGRLVVMAQAQMPGDAVLAMALGEYLVHGWDLAVATGRPWAPGGPSRANDEAARAALAFLETTVQPEYRGPDSGFFGHEVEAAADATAFERLLCFGGRQPGWALDGSTD